MTAERYDLAVIGGGISGVGVAREAAARGLSTILLERGSICGATSANSLRIIHGGFRYLQQANLKRVIQSLKDQHDLIQRYPDHIKPFPCVMPLAATGLKSRLPVSLALKFYGMLYRFLTGDSYPGGILRSEEVEEQVPLLQGKAPYGALLWYDAQIIDLEGFVQQLVTEMGEQGVEIAEESAVNQVEARKDDYLLHLSDQQIEAQYVVNATGPWVTAKSNWPVALPSTEWAVGYNIVLKRGYEGKHGIGIQSDQGRLFFLTPRGSGQCAVGTWYKPYYQDTEIGNAQLTEDLQEICTALPHLQVTLEDVVDVEIGILPMKGIRHGEPVLVSGEKIYTDLKYAAILSTKFTTFQSQARATLNQLGLV